MATKIIGLSSPFVLMLLAIALGVGIGHQFPSQALQLKPLGDSFIMAVRWLVCPIVFVTIAAGGASVGQARKLGKLGMKTIVYFEFASTIALITGFAVAHVLQPGIGFPISAFDAAALAPSASPLQGTGTVEVFRALRESVFLQSLLGGAICGLVLVIMGQRARPAVDLLNRLTGLLLKILNVLMLFAPIAALAAIAFTVSKFGIASLGPLMKLLVAIYIGVAVFILVPLAVVARCAGFRILRLAWFVKEELVLVFGTSSSMTAMPALIQKLARAGCSKAAVGFIIPAGYSFNLNASNVYVAVAAAFLAQAMQVELGLYQYLSLLAVASITAKGATGVTGAAFIVLTATVSTVPGIPETSLLYVAGIERLLKCRPIGNVISNAAASLAIAAWDGSLDRKAMRSAGLTPK